MSAAALYDGHVAHWRREPVARSFRYRIAFAELDLDRLDEAFDGRRLAAWRRWAPIRFRRSDHLGDPARPLDVCVRDRVEAECGRRPAGPIRLLTQLRQWGLGFNPASFYFCWSADDERLEGVLVEVTNTPWGERHVYWVDAETASGDRNEVRMAKTFHVSPFMGMDSTYAFRIGRPGERLEIEIDCEREGRRFFGARVDLERRRWSTRELVRLALVHFARPLRLHLLIFWQALRLFAAGAPFYSHPGRDLPPSEVSRSDESTAPEALSS